VFALLTSPLAAGLFHKAIGQSGSPFSFRSTRTLRDAEQIGAGLAEAWGATALDQLRALPAEALLGDNIASYRAAGYGPNIDGWALPAQPARLMVEGRYHNVPLLVGATADEFTPMAAGIPTSAEAFRQQAAQRFGRQAEQFLALYPADNDEQAIWAQIASMSDQMLAGMRVWANVHHKHGQHSPYLYYFDRKLPGRDSAFFGAFHSGELYYVFDTLDSTDRPWERADRRLAEAMTSYWANFAATGDPNGPGLPSWPAYEQQAEQVMRLGEAIGAIPVPKKAEIALFQSEIEEWLKRL
jgi:para-nitrobenzyl esterase